jgi:hypothetical protein
VCQASSIGRSTSGIRSKVSADATVLHRLHAHDRIAVSSGEQEVRLTPSELWHQSTVKMLAVGLLLRARRRLLLQRRAARLLAVSLFVCSHRRRAQRVRLLQLWSLGVWMLAVRWRERRRRCAKLHAVGVLLRSLRWRKEELRRQRQMDALALLRTPGQARLKNLHWERLPCVDRTIFDHDVADNDSPLRNTALFEDLELQFGHNAVVPGSGTGTPSGTEAAKPRSSKVPRIWKAVSAPIAVLYLPCPVYLCR